ncbi:MAG: DUF1926 domain-containing protein [Candidatus Omnitrophica bacterium]|nr:DUF1926 domain-containing protein [Candidatus Omnitrophota bacterium]
MGKVYFIFGLHNHQPVGNFDHVFEEAYSKSYFPFLALLDKFPSIKFSLHNSGCLYDWILENKPEYIDILKKMVNRGQVEAVSGGYYEPILPLISDADKIGQIEQMNSFLKKEFSASPTGIWIAERVWEQYLARVINSCDLKYTFLDDTHFRSAGYNEDEFFNYYVTEDSGKEISIFPISKILRYKIPFSQPYEAVEVLSSFARDRNVLVTLFDDGEKFGLWPETYQWVYEKKWLEQFLDLLKDSKLIETVHPKDALNLVPSGGLIYFPSASYEEMGEWVLEPQAFREYERVKNSLKNNNQQQDLNFLTGGIFRNFYRKYARLNYMHKRMLFTSEAIHKTADSKKDKKIFSSLWKSQTNCGYWHGVFGGFYLGHIRGAVFENLIEAETLCDKKYSTEDLVIKESDFTFDGCSKIMVKTPDIISCFSARGGTIQELSLRSEKTNLVNTITRQEESYHKKIKENVASGEGLSSIHDRVVQKESGLDKLLIYDQYQRVALADHLLDKDIDIDKFNNQSGVKTLSNDIYSVSIKKQKGGSFVQYQYQKSDLAFSKKITFPKICSLEILYSFSKSDCFKYSDFGIEFNLSLPSINHIFRKDKTAMSPLSVAGFFKEEKSFVVRDEHKKIDIQFDFDNADVLTQPIYSVSSSESGFEKSYQQIALLFIKRNDKNEFNLSLRIEKLK